MTKSCNKSITTKQRKLFQFARCIFLLLVIAGVTLGDLPDNPCPEIFQYKFDGYDWLGLIQLNNTEVNQTVNIVVELSLPTSLPSDYKGRLDLLEEQQEEVQSVLQSKRLFYKITFPLKNPISRIIKIVVDKVVLCNGPADQNPQATKYKLYHIFYPNMSRSLSKIIDISDIETSSDGRGQNIPNMSRSLSKIIDISDIETSSDEQAETVNFSGKKPKAPGMDCGVLEPNNVTQFAIEGSTIKGEWLWMAAIFLRYGQTRIFLCSGTLLTSKVTITAAHCFFRLENRGRRKNLMSPSQVSTILGQYDINNWAESGSEHLPTERIEFPPDFEESTLYEKDIALIIHIRPVEFAYYPLIRPTCLWSGFGNFREIDGRLGVVIGWEIGKRNAPSSKPKLLQVGIVSRETCIRGNDRLGKITADTNFCTTKREKKPPCTGFAGSGLVIFNNDHWELRGVLLADILKLNIKHDQICNDFDPYSIYVDIFAFKDWILQIIAP